MEMGRIFLSRPVAFSFFGNYVNQHRMIQLFCLLEGAAQLSDIMAVNGPQIGNSHIFKQHSRNQQLFNSIFGTLNLINNRLTARNLVQRIADPFF